MSQQYTIQASGQEMLKHMFKLHEHNTTAWTEVIVGFTAFPTMTHIVFANSQILGAAGMGTSVVFVIACLITAFGSVMIGLSVSPPAALALAMGLDAFFASVVVQTMDLPWQVGVGAIFWGAVGLLLLTIFRVRHWMIANIPVSLRAGITSDTGLFIGMVRLKNVGVIAASPETLVSIGNLTLHNVLLGILGLFIIAILASRNIHAAVLVSIVVTALLGWMLDDVRYNGIISAPPSVMTVMGHVDLAGSLNFGLAGVTFSFILVNLLDSSDTLISAADKAGPADKKGKFPCMRQVLYVDSVFSATGSFIGTSSATVYIESSSGASVDGCTGLTAMVVGLLFLLVIFLSPLMGMVPSYAAAGALTYVDVLMTSSLARVDWQGLTGSVPVFIIAVVMSLSSSITEGITLGLIFCYVMKIGTGCLRDPSPRIIIVALMLILKIASIDAH